MSQFFRDVDHLYQVFDTFFNRLRLHPDIGPRVLALGANMRFLTEDPHGEMTIDTTTPDGRVIMGPAPDVDCEIVMRMKADAGHRFWLGELNLMKALTTRQMSVVQGSVTKILKLLPILRPAHAIYREVWQELEGE